MTSGQNDRKFLDGMKVLDFTRVIAGPYCTMMLADMGADVVKVEEKTSGDEMRHIVYEGRSSRDQDYFNSINRSKRSVGLDLKDQKDKDLVLALAGKADVVVENFAPGVADRLGVGWDALRRKQPKLIYCSISGFGQTGPYRRRPALDPVIQALSGVMSVTGHRDGEPLTVGAPVADVTAGMFAAFAIACAWVGRLNGDKGRYIDISMLDSMIAVLAPRMAEALQAHRSPHRYGNGNPMRVPTNTYKTKDGRYLMICVLNDRHWAPLCQALERKDLCDRVEFRTMGGRRENRAQLDSTISREINLRNAQEWETRLEKFGVPFGTVNDYMQAIEDPQIAHRQLIRELAHPASGHIRVIGTPWKIDDTDMDMTPPPVLGQHMAEVLTEWLSG